MKRRTVLLMPTALASVEPRTINSFWQDFVKAANQWSTDWNAMVTDAGTVSIKEYKQWQECERLWEQLGKERRRQLKGER